MSTITDPNPTNLPTSQETTNMSTITAPATVDTPTLRAFLEKAPNLDKKVANNAVRALKAGDVVSFRCQGVRQPFQDAPAPIISVLSPVELDGDVVWAGGYCLGHQGDEMADAAASLRLQALVKTTSLMDYVPNGAPSIQDVLGDDVETHMPEGVSSWGLALLALGLIGEDGLTADDEPEDESEPEDDEDAPSTDMVNASALPYLRTGDTVRLRWEGSDEFEEDEYDVQVHPNGITFSPYCLQTAEGAPGIGITGFSIIGMAAAPEDSHLLDNVKPGDVVRATFLDGAYDEPAEAQVYVDTVAEGQEGDRWLPSEGMYLEYLGIPARSLRALEVLSRKSEDMPVLGDTDAPLQDRTPMTLSEYGERAAETAIFPGQGEFWGLQYVAAGLANEVGEVLGIVKKMQRDGGYGPEDDTISFDDRAALKSELSDVAWYLAMVCREAALDPDEVLSYNLEKLADRRTRGVLGGSGDNR